VELRHWVRVAVAGGLLPVLLGWSSGPTARPADPPTPAPGYHHLGATTEGTWSGVLGRVSIRDPGVREGTFDFVATRFMAKADTPDGVKWLEAGWAETGWSGGGQQRIYTFDTNTGHWTFYDQYPVKSGDQVWIELLATGTAASPTWSAWLWWSGGWHLLTSQQLPLTDHATIEEYVEVYVDPTRGDSIGVPSVQVDNVQLERDPSGAMEPWNGAVDTLPGEGTDGYCLAFQVPYDTWDAGSC
jgi:hypothetical protein